eukprot:CAMPEP_0174369512 /NCGR_PEP_ID=MMETSP0811_2-20130205/92773_1 /TAXON_ID=73025 ORGANISM="Eutreptiella gymnastica-like, Strain CCMP1594" /NCGR_SAMPLE_ID=MMETSP0811_2 /ASSEMBLY_ACC=CAM_ASM_000667 /LENGTH=169 /DNA_ID=CAMNT_0015514037 /DNA_START=232 /DNA_END=739 /DNA_ORIENTATION=+
MIHHSCEQPQEDQQEHSHVHQEVAGNRGVVHEVHCGHCNRHQPQQQWDIAADQQRLGNSPNTWKLYLAQQGLAHLRLILHLRVQIIDLSPCSKSHHWGPYLLHVSAHTWLTLAVGASLGSTAPTAPTAPTALTEAAWQVLHMTAKMEQLGDSVCGTDAAAIDNAPAKSK